MRITLALLLAFACSTVIRAAERFVYGGLRLDTTIDDVKRVYPRSTVSDHLVRVADADVRDDVRTIELPGPANPRLRILFERTTSRGPMYPACDLVLANLRKAYGAPSTMQEFDEERARDRRYVWSRPNEVLSLLCFRLGRPIFFATELTIAPHPPSP